MTAPRQPWEVVPLDTEASTLVGAHLLIVGDPTALVLSIDPPRETGYGELGGQLVVSGLAKHARPTYRPKRLAPELHGQLRVAGSMNLGLLGHTRLWEVPGFTTVAALALACGVTATRAFRLDAIRRTVLGPPRLVHNGTMMTIDEAVALLPVAPDPRATAQARVARVRTTYGRMLADIAYRIENSALFDTAVPTTASFESALALWSDVTAATSDEEVVRRSAMVTVTFDTARAHAETVGLAHLPLTARDQGRRAAGAARLARSATTEAERAAAEAQVVRILGSLALYYLPGADDFRRAITER